MSVGVKRKRSRWLPLALLAVLAAGTAGVWAARALLFPDALAAGLTAYRRGDWVGASNEARARLKTEKNDLEAVRLLARSSARLGQDQPAAGLFRRLGDKAMDAEDFQLEGQVLDRLGSREGAIKAWESAVALDPGRGEALAALATAYARQDRLDKAAESAERLSHLSGWETRGALMLGVLRVDLDDPEGAAAALGETERRDPAAFTNGATGLRYRKLLARLELRLGRPAEAKAELQAVLAAGSDAEASWLLSRAYLQEGDAAKAAAALRAAGPSKPGQPYELEPSPFVGEARCTDCHRTIAREHAASRHARTFHRGSQLKSLPVPEAPVPDPGDPSVVHTIAHAGDGIEVSTQLDGRVVHGLVEYAFGTRDHYLTMVARNDRGEHRAVRLSYYRTGNSSGWDLTSGDTLHPDTRDGYLGRPMEVRNGVVRCLFCHVTDARPDPQNRGPEAADAAVGCERCHGPGANHLKAVALKFPDLAIANPAAAPPELLTTKVCGQCHNLNDLQTERTTLHTDPLWIRSPAKSLTWSRCYTESAGALTCLTCHETHGRPATSASDYESKCLACHAASTADEARHTSCPVSPSKDCLGCHMPRVPNALLHSSLTDHYIRIREAGRNSK